MTQKKYDVVICGGGPAGLSAAIWCADLGLSAVVLEASDRSGGQLNRIYAPIRNYPGIIETTGSNLAATFARQVESARVPIVYGAPIVEFDPEDRSVTVSDGTRYSGRYLVIATGVRRRKLNIPGEDDFVGKGILESGAKQAAEVAGKHVTIVGGGDAAIENAVILSKTAAKVTVIHRRDSLAARAELISEARSGTNVEFLFESELCRIEGRDRIEKVHLSGRAGGVIETSYVLIRIGVEPHSETFRAHVMTDERGYIVTDSQCYTGVQNVYAIGDVSAAESPTISSASGHGSTAAKAIAARQLNVG